MRFSTNTPVFRHEEFAAFLAGTGTGSKKTREALLACQVKVGQLPGIRRGLYAVVPSGTIKYRRPVKLPVTRPDGWP